MKSIEEKTDKTDKTALTEWEKPEMVDLRKGTSYRVKGKETLDSMLSYQQANLRNISTFIVDKGQDSEKAWATVQAVHPRTGQKIEDTVFFYFDSVKDLFLLEAIEKAEKKGLNIIQGFDEDGKPIIQIDSQRALIRRFIRFKHFAVRDAITKAARRALLKMMNIEWREDDVEIGYEKMEEDIVKNSIKDQQNNTFSSSGTSAPILKNNPQIIEDETEFQNMPVFPEPTKDEIGFNNYYQEFLLEQSESKNVFPPNSLKDLENSAKNTPLEFLIRDTTYHNISYGHYDDQNNPEVTQMTVEFGEKGVVNTLLKKKLRITIFLHRNTGEFWIAKTTRAIFGDFKVPYLTATGYGKNWWFGPQSTYQTIKKMKEQKKTK